MILFALRWTTRNPVPEEIRSVGRLISRGGQKLMVILVRDGVPIDEVPCCVHGLALKVLRIWNDFVGTQEASCGLVEE